MLSQTNQTRSMILILSFCSAHQQENLKIVGNDIAKFVHCLDHTSKRTSIHIHHQYTWNGREISVMRHKKKRNPMAVCCCNIQCEFTLISVSYINEEPLITEKAVTLDCHCKQQAIDLLSRFQTWKAEIFSDRYLLMSIL